MKFAELGVQCRSVEKSEGMNCKRRFTYPSEAEAEELEEEAENGAQRTRTTNKSWNQKKKRRGYCVISDPGFFSLLLFLPCKRLQQCCFPNFRNLKHNQFIIVQIQKKKNREKRRLGAESGRQRVGYRVLEPLHYIVSTWPGPRASLSWLPPLFFSHLPQYPSPTYFFFWSNPPPISISIINSLVISVSPYPSVSTSFSIYHYPHLSPNLSYINKI